ncbi:MAG: ABC transporter permease, partial [Deltaproteobacteria bacterium]|nr:ABC transporter permease [Deltaproteobacteria bacterium]
SSITPFQLLLGKVFGLGGATLTQLFIWILMGAGLYFGSGAFAIAVDPGITKIVFNPIVLIFFCLFLIFGYLMFATMFALLGSIVNSEKEAQNFVMPITMLLVVPIVIGISVVQEPNSAMARTLSMIPFFAPTLMTMRIIFVAPSVTEYSLFSGICGRKSGRAHGCTALPLEAGVNQGTQERLRCGRCVLFAGYISSHERGRGAGSPAQS